jgi:DNA primase
LGIIFIDALRAPKCLCPFHEDKIPSFSINLKKNKGKCFSCMEKKGKVVDIIEFTATIIGCSPKEAAEKICEDLAL